MAGEWGIHLDVTKEKIFLKDCERMRERERERERESWREGYICSNKGERLFFKKERSKLHWKD